jgi:hypothetical protein
VSSRFEVELGLDGLAADLLALGQSAPYVMARALNRAGVSGKTAMTRAIHEDTGIASKDVGREIQLEKATKTKTVVALQIRGRRIPLIAFKARGPEPSRGKGKGVSYTLPGGRGRVPDAFITTLGVGGHRGVYKRRGRPRLPIDELFGPSLPHVFEKFIPVFAQAAGESFRKNLASEISFERSKDKGVE